MVSLFHIILYEYIETCNYKKLNIVNFWREIIFFGPHRTRMIILNTYLRNIQTPVLSIALLIPFQEASMLYFCFAVRGNLESTCWTDVAPPISSNLLWFSAFPLPANFPNSHPISRSKVEELLPQFTAHKITPTMEQQLKFYPKNDSF